MSTRISTFLSRFRYIWAFAIFAFIALCLCSPVQATTVVDVRVWGAKGDGVTDDSDAIYRAFNYIQRVTYKNHDNANSVYFPDGNYKIGSGHPKLFCNSFTIRGTKGAHINLADPNAQINITGKGAQLLYVTINNTGSQQTAGVVCTAAGNSLISTITLNGWNTAIKAVSCTGLTVQWVTANLPAGATGLQILNQSSVNITHCTFTGAGSGSAIKYNPLKNTLTIDQSSFNQLTFGALYYNDNSDTPELGSLSITNSKFTNCSSTYGGYLNTFQFKNNVVTNSPYGVWVHNSKTLSIQNNQILTPAYYGMYIERDFAYKVAGSSANVSGNTISNVASGYYGIYIQGSNVTVSDNTLTGNNAMYGIFSYNLALNGTNIIFKNNNISNFSYGIATEYCNDTQSTNNTISKIQNNAIYSYHDTQLTADSNKMSDCGLTSGAYSVIYVIGADSNNSGQNYTVKNNSYTAADTSNLKYYIYVDASNNADVHLSGNTTNTMLSNYP